MLFWFLLELLLALTGLSVSPQEKFYSNIYDYAYELNPGVHMPLGNDPDRALKINRFGFRGPEINKTKSPNSYRIFCLGDSSTFGHYLPYEKTYCALLADELEGAFGHGVRVETVNAGIPGTAITQQVYLLEKKLVDFNPDMVVLYSVPSLAMELVAMGSLRDAQKEKETGPIIKLARRFNTYKFLRRIIKGSLKNTARANMERLLKFYHDHEALDINRRLNYSQDIKWFVKTCKKNDIKPVLVQNIHIQILKTLREKKLVPKTDEYEEFFLNFASGYAMTLFAAVENLDTTLVNPYDLILLEEADDRIFFEDGFHPKETGHELIAKSIAEAIRKSQL